MICKFVQTSNVHEQWKGANLMFELMKMDLFIKNNKIK